MREITKTEEEDELRPEYDLSKLEGGVRGKYAQRYKEGAYIVRRDRKFRSSDSPGDR